MPIEYIKLGEKLISNLQVAMSTTQLITATIGAVITYIIYIVEKKAIKE